MVSTSFTIAEVSTQKIYTKRMHVATVIKLNHETFIFPKIEFNFEFTPLPFLIMRKKKRRRVAKKRRRKSSIVKKKHVKGSLCQLVNSSSKISLFLYIIGIIIITNRSQNKVYLYKKF